MKNRKMSKKQILKLANECKKENSNFWVNWLMVSDSVDIIETHLLIINLGFTVGTTQIKEEYKETFIKDCIKGLQLLPQMEYIPVNNK